MDFNRLEDDTRTQHGYQLEQLCQRLVMLDNRDLHGYLTVTAAAEVLDVLRGLEWGECLDLSVARNHIYRAPCPYAKRRIMALYRPLSILPIYSYALDLGSDIDINDLSCHVWQSGHQLHCEVNRSLLGDAEPATEIYLKTVTRYGKELICDVYCGDESFYALEQQYRFNWLKGTVEQPELLQTIGQLKSWWWEHIHDIIITGSEYKPFITLLD